MSYELNEFSVNLGIMAAGAGTVVVPIFYNPEQNGRITIVHASSVCVGVGAIGTSQMSLVDLGTSGSVNEKVIWTLGSGGTMTVYDGYVPIIGTEVSAQLPAGHWMGISHGPGTAGTLTLVHVAYVKGVTGG